MHSLLSLDTEKGKAMASKALKIWVKLERRLVAIAIAVWLEQSIHDLVESYQFGRADRRRRQLRRVNRLLDHGDPWHDKARA